MAGMNKAADRFREGNFGPGLGSDGFKTRADQHHNAYYDHFSGSVPKQNETAPQKRAVNRIPRYW